MAKTIYTGLFINDPYFRKALKGTLPERVDRLHLTLQWKPDELQENIIGSTALLLVSGYGNDGRNEGYKVTGIVTDAEEVEALYNLVKTPHITTSLAKGAHAVDTADLSFEPVDKPFFVEATFGAFMSDGTCKFRKEEKTA